MARGSRSRVVDRVRSVVIVGTVLAAGMGSTAQAEVRVVPVQRDCEISKLAGSGCSGNPIQIGAYLDRQWRIWRGLYRFDVAATIPAGAHVTSATLNLRGGVGGGEEILTAHKVTTAWDDSVDWDFPWTTDGGDFAPEAASGYPRDAAWSAFDVTDVVDDWVNGRHPNHGLLVHWPDPEEGGGGGPEYMFYFTSAEAASNRPYLEVTYEDRTVVHAREFTADPAAGGQLIAEEWVDLLDGSARHEEPGWLVTRGVVPCSDTDPSGPLCGEVRERTTYSDADPTQADTYDVQRGLSVDDPHLSKVVDLLEVNPPIGSADGQGPLAQALQPWQVPPPLHGSEYLRFVVDDVLSTGDPGDVADEEQPEAAGTDVKTIVWVDRATQMPLKVRVEELDGSLVDESYWTYDPSRIDAATLPSDHFLAPRPVNVEQDQEVIAQPSGFVTTASASEFAGLGFEPYFLGESFSAPQGRFCLARLALIRLQEPSEDPPERGGAGPGVNPSGTSVWVNAAYNELEPSERCVPHKGSLAAPALEVNTSASTGSTATAWRVGYRRHGVPTRRSGPAPAFDPSVGVPSLDADPSVLRVVPLHSQSSAVLGEKGRTTVSVVGPHERATPSQVAELLEELEVTR